MRFLVTPAPSEKDIEYIRRQLRQYNQRFVGCAEVESVAVFALNNENRKIGALSGMTWGNWIQIQLLWVDEEERGNGVGSQLLDEAEKVARERGCLYSLVDTFSFQALPFYLRKGYEIKMTLDNFPENQQRYYLLRDLSIS